MNKNALGHHYNTLSLYSSTILLAPEPRGQVPFRSGRLLLHLAVNLVDLLERLCLGRLGVRLRLVLRLGKLLVGGGNLSLH
jgi:hypothetical protein